MPGAFTPTCSDYHLPSFVIRHDDLVAKGVDTIACISVNDPFVMAAWGESQNVGDAVELLADGNGEFTAAVGLEMDGSGLDSAPAPSAMPWCWRTAWSPSCSSSRAAVSLSAPPTPSSSTSRRQPAVDLIEALRTTGAVREFTDEAVDDATVHRLLDTARFAPNGGNRQAWRVVVVQDPELRLVLRDVYLPGWYEYLAQVSAGLTPWAAVTDVELERRAVAGAATSPPRPPPVRAGSPSTSTRCR